MILDLRTRVLLHVGVDDMVGDFSVKQIEAKPFSFIVARVLDLC